MPSQNTYDPGVSPLALSEDPLAMTRAEIARLASVPDPREQAAMDAAAKAAQDREAINRERKGKGISVFTMVHCDWVKATAAAHPLHSHAKIASLFYRNFQRAIGTQTIAKMIDGSWQRELPKIDPMALFGERLPETEPVTLHPRPMPDPCPSAEPKLTAVPIVGRGGFRPGSGRKPKSKAEPEKPKPKVVPSPIVSPTRSTPMSNPSLDGQAEIRNEVIRKPEEPSIAVRTQSEDLSILPSWRRQIEALTAICQALEGLEPTQAKWVIDAAVSLNGSVRVISVANPGSPHN